LGLDDNLTIPVVSACMLWIPLIGFGLGHWYRYILHYQYYYLFLVFFLLVYIIIVFVFVV
jgi:hypothetical protein